MSKKQVKKEELIKIIEEKNSYEFLRNLNNGEKLTDRDLEILEYLLVDMKLESVMVNLLLYEMLKKNNNKVCFSYIKRYVEKNIDILQKVKTGTEAIDIINEFSYLG